MIKLKKENKNMIKLKNNKLRYEIIFDDFNDIKKRSTIKLEKFS